MVGIVEFWSTLFWWETVGFLPGWKLPMLCASRYLGFSSANASTRLATEAVLPIDITHVICSVGRSRRRESGQLACRRLWPRTANSRSSGGSRSTAPCDSVLPPTGRLVPPSSEPATVFTMAGYSQRDWKTVRMTICYIVIMLLLIIIIFHVSLADIGYNTFEENI